MSNDSGVTLYEILGIVEDATSDQIRTAYRKQAKLAHPDMGGSAHTMHLLNKAFRILKDPKLRTQYDRTLHEPKTQERPHKQQAAYPSAPPPPPAPRQPSTEELIQQEKQTVAQIKTAAKKMVAKGFGLIILGIIITAVSYNMTSSGGTYFVLWGLVVWGLIEVFRGWYHTLNPYASLHKVLDKPGHPYKFLLEKKERHSWAISMIAISCFGLLIMFIALANSGSGGATANTQAQTSSSAAVDSYGYPIAYATNFTQACVNNGGTDTKCACALNLVESTYTYDQALQFDQANSLPSDLNARISNICQ